MSLIKRECIERIINTANIVEVFETLGHVKSKRGVNFFFKSPWSDEKTPSCCVSPTRQTFMDYSADKSGNVITLLMEGENKTFPEAVKWLADHYNIELEYEDEQRAKQAIERKNYQESLRPLLKEAHAQYRAAFKQLPEDHPAKKEVLEKREYTKDLALEWGIGYAPGGKFLFDKIAEKDRKNAEQLFLIGEKYDKYWERVIYPIHDKNSLLIGFAGRDISGKENSAKWINPTETPLYNKDKVWFGLHKAHRAIAKKDEAWILEGYNDLIAWHRFDILNAVAGCGTAITESQIVELKRYTKNVRFAFDGDKVGNRAMTKYIPLFMKHGFTVYVCRLDDLDPDDFVRANADSITNAKGGLEGLLSHADYKVHGFKYLMNEQIDKSDEFTLNSSTQELCRTIALVDDFDHRSFMIGWLAKESKVKETSIKAWVNGYMEKSNARTLEESEYEFPKGIDVDKSVVIPKVKRFGLFMAGQRIWMKRGEQSPFAFQAVSNFEIEIIQHMKDEKFPSKLIRVMNVQKEESIFHCVSDAINTVQSFFKVCTDQGQYFFKGNRQDHMKLLEYLMFNMGTGSKIDILGWQHEGFWVMRNRVIIPKANIDDAPEVMEIDDNGVFKVKKEGKVNCYYVPSANKIYANNEFQYSAQKKVIGYDKPSFTINQYFSKIVQVHRGHGITAVLFTIASVFQDIIVDELNSFPMIFFYGPPNTGKDVLIDSCMKIFGKPQEAINLEADISTAKAQIREFAQFRNMIGHLSEYISGDKTKDGMLKGLWDRRGYKRGNLESMVSTETIPISSAVMITGNDYPGADALITRFLNEEMLRQDFDAESVKFFEELKDMSREGISYFLIELLRYRSLVKEKFQDAFRASFKKLRGEYKFAGKETRIVQNVAVLDAMYHMLKDHIQFPFEIQRFVDHQSEMIQRQMARLASASNIVKWWDSFLAAVRNNQDPLVHGREFKVADNKVYFNFTHTYNRVQRQWWMQYHEQAPSKVETIKMLKADIAWIGTKSAERLDGTSKGVTTSVYVMDMDHIKAADDIYSMLEWLNKTDVPGYGQGNPPEFAKNPQMNLDSSLPPSKEEPF